MCRWDCANKLALAKAVRKAKARQVVRNFKPRPFQRNRIATFLGATCCMRFGYPVAMCLDMLGVVGLNLKVDKFLAQHLCMRLMSFGQARAAMLHPAGMHANSIYST